MVRTSIYIYRYKLLQSRYKWAFLNIDTILDAPYLEKIANL